MRVGLIAVLAALCLLFLLLFLPVGIEMHFGDETVTDIRIGFIRKKADTSAPKKKKKEKKKKPKKEKKERLKFGAREAGRALTELLPQVKRAMTHFRRSLVFNPLDLQITVGGADPFETAKTYGYASAALYALMPLLEEACTVKRPHVVLLPDMNAEETKCRGELGVSANVGSLLVFAGMLLAPVLRFYRSIPRVPLAADTKNGTERKGEQNGR